MSPVRLLNRAQFLAPFFVIAACAPAQKATAPAAAPSANSEAVAADAPPPASAPPTAKRCGYSVRRVSAAGRGAMRPQLAAVADAFAVAWEETTDHRSIRVQTFAPDASPLGTSIEVADVARAAAEPRLAANSAGDGFAVFWSATHGDASAALEMRRIDRAGRPKSDALPVVVAPGARALDAVALDSGYAVAWWNWSNTPHQLAVTFVDKEGRPVGKPLPVTRAPSPDPTVDIAPGAALGKKSTAVLAWDETIGDAEHIVIGDLARDSLQGRADLGPGETPRFGGGVVVFERPSEASIWMGRVGVGAPMRVTDGHVPAAASRAPLVTALCYLRDTDPSEQGHVDELVCGTLLPTGTIVDQTRIAVGPRGLFGLQVATSGSHIGVTWQTQEEDDTTVSFAALTCPEVAAAAQAPK